MRTFSPIVLGFFTLALGNSLLANDEGKKIDFGRQIRPLLTENCFHCHGPDPKARKAKLRLDTREGLLGPTRGGEPIVRPGKSAESELFLRLTTTDHKERMPPVKSDKKLTAEQIALFKTWIDQGAQWSDHWAFLPPRRPEPPTTGNPAWVRTPIDAFVLARLEKEKLAPAPEADRTTLLRRLSLDLIGLPPTPREVEAFLNDPAPDAYEKVVDRLLASKHYGERMAMPWLDYARFADSNGFQTDSSRGMWPWRDWVIQAYNSNMPFDQFTIEQLAGDLLPDAKRSQIVATGFHRNHRLNGEGGIIAAEWRIENIVDRVDTTGLTWLGLTLGCARCHDHRFDPITQKEYYQLFAFFNNVPEQGTLIANRKGGNTDPVVFVPTPEHDAEIARLEAKVKEAEQTLRGGARNVDHAKLAQLEATLRKHLKNGGTTWTPLEPTRLTSTGGVAFVKQTDGSYLATGKTPKLDTYTITAPLAPGPLSGLLLECFPDASLPNQSLGRHTNGNFVLTRVEATIVVPEGEDQIPVKFARVEADYSQADWNINNVLGKQPTKGWAVDGPTKREPRRALFVAAEPITVPEDAMLKVRLVQETLPNHQIGRFRLAITSAAPSLVQLSDLVLSDPIKKVLDTPVEKRTAAQTDELVSFLGDKLRLPVKEAEVNLSKARKELQAAEAGLPTVMVMQEGPPRDAYVLLRGQYDKRGEKVGAALPEVFGALPAGAPVNRLGLARWIVDPANPLTARVWVNRAWEHFFGLGLVKSSENLGSQADVPSHPELLDWLATEFVRLKWDMKAMHKLIVMSATYRQSSRVTPALRERDPENRLLARGARFRIQAELIRDQALAAGGLLAPRIGGPSVRPYMPDGVWDETSVYGDLRNYKADSGENLYRRTMYTIWKRTAAPPSMLLFDAPGREVCSVRRSRTNTPLQALALLNEITYVEAARRMGERMMLEGGNEPDQRLTYGFRLVAGRAPRDQELKVLRDGYHHDLAHFTKDAAAARKLIEQGQTPPNKSLDVPQLAAYTLAANVLLNLDEVVTRE